MTKKQLSEKQINKKLAGHFCKHFYIYLKKNKTNDMFRQFFKCKLDNRWCNGERFYYDCYRRRDLE